MSAPQVDQVKTWIRGRLPHLTDIGPEEDLIESRMVDSLGFMEFLILIEKLSGQPIDIDSLDINDFRTLSRISSRFFS